MLDLLLPPRCVLCKRSGRGLCLKCLCELPPSPDLAPPPGFENFGSLLTYEGDTRRLIAAIKFDGRRDAIGLAARVLAKLVDWHPECVTWAPTSPQRRRRRGFDQAELLAREVASELGLPCVSLLVRVTSGHQTGRSRAERLGGTEFTCAGGTETVGKMRPTLLIDDIRTTGATLCAAGDALLDAGVPAVSALTLAVTL